MTEAHGRRLAQLAERVGRAIGLHFPPQRLPDLERGLACAAPDFGFADADACIEWLLASRWSEKQLETLAHHLTVGETYFFREKNTFDMLGKSVSAGLRARHAADRTLRIWSAGCATGEEPYSIAIELLESMPDLADWNISLLATDINRRFLEKASRGVYGKWSFRQCPPRLKTKYFTEIKKGVFKICPEVARMVTFARHNLARDVFPSPQNNTDNLDIVFCRNVLMYFTPAVTRATLARFHSCLADRGYLIVSASEASAVPKDGFTPVGPAGGSPIYQKTTAGASRGPAEAKRPALSCLSVPPLSPATAPRTRRQIGHFEAVQVSRQMSIAQPPAGAARIDPGRLRANEGNFSEAVRCCRKAIDTDKLNPAHYYLLATVLSEQGQIEEASRYLQKALYLDPDFVLAHFALGSLMTRLGKTVESARHFGNALSLLRKYRPGDILPEAGGITAGHLAEVISRLIEVRV